jgi:hypothetical protein
MSDIERIEVNQPFRLIITCYMDGALVDLSTTSARSIEYKDPAGVETKVSATILNPPGTDGKIYVDILVNTWSVPTIWKVKPWLTFPVLGEIPGDPQEVDVYDEWDSIPT